MKGPRQALTGATGQYRRSSLQPLGTAADGSSGRCPVSAVPAVVKR